MKIIGIRGYHVACTLPVKQRNAITVFDRREALVIEILSDAGASGWGECTVHPPLGWEFLRTHQAAGLLGRDPRLAGALWRTTTVAGGGGPLATMAASAVDMALWDLRGRLEDRSVADLLGGALRDRVCAYASGPFMTPGDDPYGGFAAEVDRLLSVGFRAFKPRSGLTPRADAGMAAALRRQVGPDVALMLDFNRGYGRVAALDVLRRLDPAELLWAEEPIAAEDLAGYSLLAEKSATPLAAGEALHALPQFDALLRTGAIAVVQPDLYLCGGFTGAQRIAALAEAAGVAYCPHVWGTAINFHASLQLAAVLAPQRLGDGLQLPLFEWDCSGNALLAITGQPAIGPHGTIAIPTGPGIGLDIEPRHLEPFLERSWELAE